MHVVCAANETIQRELDSGTRTSTDGSFQSPIISTSKYNKKCTHSVYTSVLVQCT